MLNSSTCRSVAISIIGTGFLLAGCGHRSESTVVLVEQREWTSSVGTQGVQLLTEHYDLRTTVRDPLLREYMPAFMEACHAEYGKLLPAHLTASGPDAEEKLVVYVFGRRQEWAAFTCQFVPAQAYTYLHIHSGGYMDHPTATSVLFDIGRDKTLSLMAHEGLHQYLSRYIPRPVPAWLNEGLATQFEDFDLDGPRPTFRPRRNLLRKNSLREALSIENGLLALPHLLATHAGEAVTTTGQSARGYYAQIWATVLFMRESKQYRAGFARMLEDMGSNRYRANISAYRAATPSAAGMSEGEIAFRQYITEDLEAFSASWNEFARLLVR